MTTTTQLYGYGHYTMTASVKDSVLNFLGYQATHYYIDGLVSAYRAAINDMLDGTTIALRGDDFYADYPTRSDADNVIKEAIENVDLGELAWRFDES